MVRAVGKEREPGGTQSVERALSLLDAFTPEHPERRVSELVEETGLGQSTVSRLVGALESYGFLAHDPRSGLYRIGPRVVGLSSLGLNQSPVFRQARQVAQNLAAALGLGANVAERDGARLFYLCHFEGHLAPRTFTMVGQGGPLHATGLGKALLSELPAAEIEALLGTTLPTYTPKTVSKLSELLDALEEVRSRGYATEVEELAFGRACVAAPVRDRSGRVLASLSVSGPLSALDLPNRQAELATRVIEQADQISTALGYSGISLAAQRP
ncbi:IclR family transcriptional regulator [Actinopolymorpha pittospori]|uniref:DNA-binding IclR family transcriptional regulator n=1 Tax=Actinopolymorpha pittospori TaxID=648752 RepID=A0A927N930_9ACTN|nr:IclR family transcriptional regulator [Actinopolymorpha pittospori]MBE1613238.1 DNA-binding IclR family transcriptional regulator [Actinopolymorpha pittospori]